MLDVALHLHAPVLNVASGVAQRLERHANLDLEAPRRDASLRLPEEVRAQIVLSWHHVRAGNEAARLALRAICLHAEWIDDKDKCPALVMECVEMHLDVVIAADAIAIGERRVYARAPAVRLECAHAEVDRG